MYKIVSALLLFAVGHSIGMNKPENLQAKQLWDAITAGDRPKFNQLLSEGVSPLVPYTYNHPDGYVACRLPVVCAISCHQYDMAAKLLETSGARQIPGTDGNPLMHYAASTGSYECIALLISYGAVVDKTALDIANNPGVRCTKERQQTTIKEINRYLALKNKPQKLPLNKAHKE